jgi:hypothetical protein
MTRLHPAALALLLTACDEPVAPTLAFEHDAAFPERVPIPAPKGDLVLITNNFDDTLSYIDLGLTPPAEIARVPVGLNPVEREGPHHVAISADGLAWVGISNFVPNSGSGPHGAHGAGTSPGHALLIRIADGLEVGTVRVDRNPGDIRLTPDGRLALLTHFDLLRITESRPDTPPAELDSRLALIDTATLERTFVPVCPAAHGIAIAPDSKAAYVACWDDRVAKVDLTTRAVETAPVLPIPGTLASPECQPYALTLSPDGQTLWVGCFASGELRALDTATLKRGPVVDLGGSALFGTYLADGRLAVPAQGPDALHFIDPATGGLLDSVAFDDDCVLPHVVAERGDRLLLVCEGDRVAPGSFLVLDAEGTTLHRIPVGRYPDDLAIVPILPAGVP